MLRFLGVWLTAIALTASAQQQPKALPQPKPAFFSGNVVSFDADQVTVTRRTLTLSWVTKTFLLNPDTTIEGTLKTKVRVTVKFLKTADGDHAIHIIVR